MRTAECVTPKHPDKLCDQISDAILDAALQQDPYSRVAIEAMGGHGKVVIMGEVTTRATVDYKAVAETVVGTGLDIMVHVAEQSREIAQGVDVGGAGDQGIMVGYATAETEEMIPAELAYARRLAQYLYAKYTVDGKTQCTYDEKRNAITALVASFQNTTHAQLEADVRAWLATQSVQHEGVIIHANPAGDWNMGGFDSDTGLTGRKIAVDSYGPRIPVGGGAFSGKDATKVDRSGAYMARRIATDILKARKAKEVYVYLAYSIGVAEPVQATAIVDGVKEPVTGYDLTPNGIITLLNLRSPQFKERAAWGHFGHNGN
jgi:S-adenosylmethionine synthetase